MHQKGPGAPAASALPALLHPWGPPLWGRKSPSSSPLCPRFGAGHPQSRAVTREGPSYSLLRPKCAANEHRCSLSGSWAPGRKTQTLPGGGRGGTVLPRGPAAVAEVPPLPPLWRPRLLQALRTATCRPKRPRTAQPPPCHSEPEREQFCKGWEPRGGGAGGLGTRARLMARGFGSRDRVEVGESRPARGPSGTHTESEVGGCLPEASLEHGATRPLAPETLSGARKHSHHICSFHKLLLWKHNSRRNS